MFANDGVNPFGSNVDADAGTAPPEWDTPQWRAEMEAKYGQRPVGLDG